jgi:hypothetical protein
MSIATQAQPQTDGFHFSDAIEAIFIDVGSSGARTLERLHEGLTRAIAEVIQITETITPADWNRQFKQIVDRARWLAVKKSQGGGAAEGISYVTFKNYVRTVKRTLTYEVPLEMAEDLNKGDLDRMWRYRKDVLKNTQGTAQVALDWLRAEQDRVRQEELAKAAADKAAGTMISGTPEPAPVKSVPTSRTTWVDPDPADYQSTDDGTYTLLKDVSQHMQEYFQAASFQPHLAKSFQLATVFKEFIAKLTVIEQQQGKKISEKKTATV